MSVLDNSFDYSREVSSRAAWLDNASANLMSDNSIFNSTMQRNEPSWLGAVELYDSSQNNAGRVAQEQPSSPDGAEAPEIPRTRPVNADDAPQPHVPVEPPHVPVGTTGAPEELPAVPKRPHVEVDHVQAGEPAPMESAEAPAPVVRTQRMPEQKDGADPKAGGESVPTSHAPNPDAEPGTGPRAVEGPAPPGTPRPKSLPGSPKDAAEPPQTNTPGRPSPFGDDAIPRTVGDRKQEHLEKRPEFKPTDWERKLAERLAEVAKRGAFGTPSPGGAFGKGKIAAAVPRDPNAAPPSGEQSEGTSRSGGRTGRG